MIMAGQLRRRSRYKGFTDDHGGTVEATGRYKSRYKGFTDDHGGTVEVTEPLQEPLQRVYR